jgi:hypothetical protein
MLLIHRLKGGNTHEIPLAKPAFFTMTDEFEGEITDKGWLLKMESLHDGKYKGHGFDILIAPEDVDRMYDALGKMKHRFNKENNDAADSQG